MSQSTITDPANRVRWWIAFALTAVVIAAVVVPVVMIVRARESNAVSIADEIVVRMGERTSDLVAGELATAAQSLELLALLAAAADGEDSIERALAAEVSAVPQLSGAFVGYPSGEFSFVRREDDDLVLKRVATEPSRQVTDAVIGEGLVPGTPVALPSDDYDPRMRPWYIVAAGHDEPIWTDPYVFFTSGEPGITTAVALRDERGEVTAVVGVDLALAQMSAFVADLPIDDSAEAFIVTADSVIVAPSSDPGGDLVDATGDGLDSEAVDAALAGREPVTTDTDHRLYAVALAEPNLPSWSVVVQTDEIEFLAVVGRQSRIALVATIVAALALWAAIPLMVVRLRRPIDELSRRARFDPLTGLPNRATLFDAGQDLIRRAYKTDDEVTLAVLDIDDFKSINDGFGHAVGDEALRVVGHALRQAVRQSDLVGRLGGDEFVIIMTGPHREQAPELLDGIRRSVVDHLQRDRRFDGAGVTLGVSWLANRALNIQRLIAEADHALIDAKQRAKGTVALG